MNMGKPENTKTWTKKIENHREITKNLVRKYLLCSFKLEANLSTKYVSNYTQIMRRDHFIALGANVVSKHTRE